MSISLSREPEEESAIMKLNALNADTIDACPGKAHETPNEITHLSVAFSSVHSKRRHDRRQTTFEKKQEFSKDRLQEIRQKGERSNDSEISLPSRLT